LFPVKHSIKICPVIRQPFISFMGLKEGSVVIILPTHKCRRWLPRAINSILAQTWQEFDLYVVDDGSNDVDDELLAEFSRVTFIRLRQSRGPYHIANLVLSLTESEYVAFQDADDWSHRERLTAQLSFLRQSHYLGCGSWYALLSMHGDPVGFETCPEHASEALRRGLLGNPLLHPATLYHRKLFAQIGGFDGSTRFAADSEFFWRASLKADLGNVQRFLYFQMVRPNSLTQSVETGYSSANREDYGRKIKDALAAIESGRSQIPARTQLLTGETLPPPLLDEIEWLSPGSGNFTLSGDYEKRYTRRLR
jgi:glycosyltransferase involved in cell wall biosynthesis